MDLKTLCEWIELQPAVTPKVLAFAEGFDFAPVQHWLDALPHHDGRDAAREALQACLGDDPDHIAILTCMLKAAADRHDYFRQKGIPDEIYAASMKCFTRFIEETHMATGQYRFDHAWWAVRQAGGNLFRIGALEYEILHEDGKDLISMHIPCDADFRPACCDASIQAAKAFFARYFPEVSGAPYVCHSWLLAPELEDMLPQGSNILAFQRRFDVTLSKKGGLDFLEFLFRTRDQDLQRLSEATSLQRKMKAFLLAGHRLTEARGTLK